MSTNDFRSAVTRNSISTFSTLKMCVVLAVFGTGILNAAPCPIASVAFYVASFGFGKGTCTITGVDPMGSTGELTISQVVSPDFGTGCPPLIVTPLGNANGLGFQLTPAVPWTTPGNGRRVVCEVQYIATVTRSDLSWPGIDRLYTELNGAVTDGAFDQVVEVYCPGGFTLPPDQTCPATQGKVQTLYVGPVPPLPPPGAGTTVAFKGALYFPGPHGTCTGAFNTTSCVYSSIAVNKDMDANATLGGIATITRVVNQFGPPIVFLAPVPIPVP